MRQFRWRPMRLLTLLVGACLCFGLVYSLIIRQLGKEDQVGKLNTFDDHTVKATPSHLTEYEIVEISGQINKLNAEQKIYNLEKFGPINERTRVIIIQVHTRVEYLTLLVESLSRAEDISNSLLIFSHDVYLPKLNKAIQSIAFTRVMQIFFPHSMQLHPMQFPSQSPDDCPRDISFEEAKEINCGNANYPDSHGHYREAEHTQGKHHFWWKANFIFGNVGVLDNHTGAVVFLEEDHYVTPDVLHTLNIMETAMVQNRCNGCSLLSLGTNSLFTSMAWNIQSSHSKGVVTNFQPHFLVAFNKTYWEKFKQCAPAFCSYDDCNYDYSFAYVIDACLQEDLAVLRSKAPRILHIGECGLHFKSPTCAPVKAARAIEKEIGKYSSFLFPKMLSLEVRRTKSRLPEDRPYGGWADVRDHKLCLSFVSM